MLRERVDLELVRLDGAYVWCLILFFTVTALVVQIVTVDGC